MDIPRKHLFKTGARVRIVNCTERPELNGSEAVVVEVLDFYEAMTDQFGEELLSGRKITTLNSVLKQHEDSKFFYVIDIVKPNTDGKLMRTPMHYPQSKLKRIYPAADVSFEELIKALRDGNLEPVKF